jgi:hypothetical protein
VFDRLASKGIQPTPEQTETVKEFIFEADRIGLTRAAAEAKSSGPVPAVLQDLIDAHVSGFAAAFYVSSGLALAAALLMFLLVRQRGRVMESRVFGRRSRWVISHAGMSPGLTRKPPGSV